MTTCWELNGNKYFDESLAANEIQSIGDFEDAYNETLNDIYGQVEVAGYKYDCSYALKNLDATAYQIGLSVYIDSLNEQIRDDLLQMGVGDIETIYGVEIECFDDGAKEDE